MKCQNSECSFRLLKQLTLNCIFMRKMISKKTCAKLHFKLFFSPLCGAPQGDIQMLTNIVHKSSFVHSFPSINLCRSLMLEKSPAKPKTMYVWLVSGLYMIGYGKGKNILKFPPFFRLNEENQERENSKHQMKTKTKTFLFSFDFEFEFPALDFPHSI